MFIIATGNAFDGLTLYGPFDEMESAIEFAENERLEVWDCVLVEQAESPPSGQEKSAALDTLAASFA